MSDRTPLEIGLFNLIKGIIDGEWGPYDDNHYWKMVDEELPKLGLREERRANEMSSDEWIGEPPFTSEWSEHMCSLLGKEVNITIDRDQPVVVTGTLLSFNEGGGVAIRGDDGFVTWAWPALEAAELT